MIALAGFGRRVSWRDDEYVPEMHKMTFKRALHIMSTQVYLILLLPDRALNISKKTREAKTAYNELRVRHLIIDLIHKASERCFSLTWRRWLPSVEILGKLDVMTSFLAYSKQIRIIQILKISLTRNWWVCHSKLQVHYLNEWSFSQYLHLSPRWTWGKP